MRTLGSDKNLMILKDNLSNSDLGLYYRMPTTQERVKYANDCIVRDGQDIKNNTTATRQKMGLQILVGIRDNDFAVVKDGKEVALSSDPTNPDYLADWKKEIENTGIELVEMLAAIVFDASCSMGKKKDDVEKN